MREYHKIVNMNVFFVKTILFLIQTISKTIKKNNFVSNFKKRKTLNMNSHKMKKIKKTHRQNSKIFETFNEFQKTIDSEFNEQEKHSSTSSKKKYSSSSFSKHDIDEFITNEFNKQKKQSFELVKKKSKKSIKFSSVFASIKMKEFKFVNAHFVNFRFKYVITKTAKTHFAMINRVDRKLKFLNKNMQ